MKIILFNEPSYHYLPMPMRLGFYFPNRGILTIAALLEKEKFEVEILDLFSSRLRWEDLRIFIKEKSPDIVGISGITRNAYMCMALAGLVKSVNPETIVVAGGPHFTLVPEESLRICPYIDYIVIGEGEFTFLELIKSLKVSSSKKELASISGLAFLSADEYIQTKEKSFIEDLDVLPFPAYHLIPIHAYGVPLLGNSGMGCTFSRGCIYDCDFCSEKIVWRKRWRGHGAKRMVEELKLLHDRYGKNNFWIGDDEFLQDRQRNLDFCLEMETEKLDISFLIYSRVEQLIKNGDLLKRMRNSGLIGVIVGVESYFQDRLDAWNKQLQAEDIYKMADLVHEAGIPILETDLIFGHYPDSRSTLRDIVRLSNKIKTDFLKLSLLVPWPGTDLFWRLKKEKRIKVWDYRHYDFDHGIIETKDLSVRDIEKAHSFTVAMWWLNPLRMLRNIFNRHRRSLQLFQLKLILKTLFYFLANSLKSERNKKLDAFDDSVNGFYLQHLNYIGETRGQEEKTFKIWSRVK